MEDQMEKNIRNFDYIKIAIFGFALTALWSSLHSIVLPVRLLDFVEESQKNTYLGLLTFAGLVLAVVVQPIIGNLSDRSGFRWGRRRPYILLGTVLAILFLPGIGLAGSVTFLLASYCLLQISSNIAQSAYQAFIPDFIPGEKRGQASGVKSLLELLGGIALVRLVAYLMDYYYAGEGDYWLWLALISLAAMLLAAMLFTVFTVREQPGEHTDRPAVRLPALLNSFKINIRANRGFILFLFSRGLIVMPGVMLQLFGLYFLMDYLEVDDPVSMFGNLLVIVGVFLLVTAYPAGRFSDRIGRSPIVVFSGVVGVAGIMSLLFSSGYLQLMFSGALLGIANGAFMSGSWALATDLINEGEEARYMALTNVATAGGSALARLIGPIIDIFNNNIGPGTGYQVMLFVCLACFIIGTLLVLKIKPAPDKMVPV
jgi:MFS family permease